VRELQRRAGVPLPDAQRQDDPLSVVEDIFPESKLELLVSAPKGVSATIVVDIGLLEVD
jgi:hypothetical protein